MNAERNLSEFVRRDEKQLYNYFIKIPTWISESYLKHNLGFCIVKFSKFKSMNEKMKEENRKVWEPYVKKNWGAKLTKMRKVNNGYTKVMTCGLSPSYFETHKGYIEYHKELKKLNEKYLKLMEGQKVTAKPSQ